MALNIKRLFSLDHPQVSYPEKSPHMSSSASEHCLDQDRDNLEEKEMDEDVHRQFELAEKLKKRLNIVK